MFSLFPLVVIFVFYNPRAGIDGGGVFKEFFTSLCQEVFDTDRGLWLANKRNELYPNPHAYATEGPFLLTLYHFQSRECAPSPQPELVPLHWSNSWESNV